MSWNGTYDELQQYLRRYANFADDVVPYDVVGVLHLWLALLDNLSERTLEQDVVDLAPSLSDQQADFLARLLAARHKREV